MTGLRNFLQGKCYRNTFMLLEMTSDPWRAINRGRGWLAGKMERIPLFEFQYDGI